jgi:hypothetical protein
MSKTLIVLWSILTIACVAAVHPLSVDDILKLPLDHDGQRVQIEGTLSPRHGFLNLFSQDKKQCVGLLLTPNERGMLGTYSERKVSVSGIFRAEGCGRDGICDEHLCGPGVLTDVSLISKVRHRKNRGIN